MMGMIKNSTEGIHAYQQALLDKVSGGFQAGEMMLYSAGRNTGKSHFYQKMLLESIYNTNLCREILLPTKPEPKYKFSRARWYVAEFDWRDYDQVDQWCAEQFGPQPDRPDAWTRWYHNHIHKIHFRDEKDYAWFCMRWGA